MKPFALLAKYRRVLAGMSLAATLLACDQSPPQISVVSLDNRSLCERQYQAPFSIREGIGEDFTIRLANYRITSCSEIRSSGNVGVIAIDLSNPAFPEALILGKAVGAGEISLTCKDDDGATQPVALTVNVVAQDASFPTVDRCKEDAARDAARNADGGADAEPSDDASSADRGEASAGDIDGGEASAIDGGDAGL